MPASFHPDLGNCCGRNVRFLGIRNPHTPLKSEEPIFLEQGSAEEKPIKCVDRWTVLKAPATRPNDGA